MRLNLDVREGRADKSVWTLIAALIVLMFSVRGAQAQAAETKPADARPARVETYQVFFLTHAMQQNDLNDIQTALRNMLPWAKIYGVPAQNAITMKATAEELSQAQKIVSELDIAPKIYRLTYTFREMEGGQQSGAKHFSMIAAAGVQTYLKQGSRVPVVTGVADAATSKESSQVQYLDVGLNIQATFDGVRLRTKVEQSSVAEGKSSTTVGDPDIRQTTLEGNASLVEGKPLVLGTMDLPGSTRREEIEVVAEAVK